MPNMRCCVCWEWKNKMIDTKEKLKYCLKIEKDIYFPEGEGKTSIWNPRERVYGKT